MNLLCAGSVAYDDIETKYGKAENILGGSATFASVAASFFCRPCIVGVVGKDFSPDDIEFLKSRNIDLTLLKIVEGKTFRWKGKYHEDMKGRDTICTEVNVYENFLPLLNEDARESEIVFVGNIDPMLQLKVIDQVNAPFITAADTMNLWIDVKRSFLEELLSRIDMLFINDEELFKLTGIEDVRTAGFALLRRYSVKYLIVKVGACGSFLFYSGYDKQFHMPAFPTEVKDPTGAGDTFAGGVLGWLCKSRDASWDGIKSAMIAGTVLASFCVEGMGVRHLASVTQDEISNRTKVLLQSLCG